LVIELTAFPTTRFNYVVVTGWPLSDLDDIKKALAEDARNCGVSDYDFFHRDDDVHMVGWYERNR
jgi:hypothetical protein